MKSSISAQGVAMRHRLGDDYKKVEMEKPVSQKVMVNPKLFLDNLPTALILDYLRIYRNQRI